MTWKTDSNVERVIVRRVAFDRFHTERGTLEQAEDRITVRVPMKLRRFGARKLIVGPAVDSQNTAKQIDHQPGKHPLMTALVRGWRWKMMLDTGEPATLRELARQENINASYISALLKLTLLAPEIVEAILSDTQREDLQLDHFRNAIPFEWHEQLQRFT